MPSPGGNGVRDAQPLGQRLLFQNGGEHGFVQFVKGSPADSQLPEQVTGRIDHGVTEQPLVPGVPGKKKVSRASKY